ncbi:unnamed protein product [Didymodactylos carnosus]|uniref:U3 small nucleolar RNA-interacting protein 2 n=1 Tax=Didymodactylos carnosus TaxID=1234261 RepID=A0A814HZ00_9BILA|nr:unnamed protein product [Didymodactylos carnosus]CAF1016566.1 unnamed protein product [Didymodactylos carnosus]CAF3670587.1 unnamed protein product [Didymodactylos carnosus]CAF3788104.1 unnamed protein product [Didymodactylos carnosus]
MPFFIRNRNDSKDKKQKKRKKILNNKLSQQHKSNKNFKSSNSIDSERISNKKNNLIEDDEEIPSDTDDEVEEGNEKVSTNGHYSLNNLINAENDEDEETNVHERRLNLAKQYIADIEKQEEEKNLDRDLVSERLRDDVLEQTGKLHRQVASTYTQPVLYHTCHGHQQTVTCVAVSSDGNYVYSGSKDCSIIKWCLVTGKKLHLIRRLTKPKDESAKSTATVCGHYNHVLSLALSTDGLYLVSGDKSNLIQIWNGNTCQHLKTFRGHKGPVTGLVFRRNSHQLFSASHDRSVKVWNLDEMTYVETLFGHQEPIQAIDALMRERCLTAGGRDNTLRLWKIIEESHLVFNGHKGSIDCLSFINEEHMLSGADDGSLALWTVNKRRPLFHLPHAHKPLTTIDILDSSLPEEYWITALTALRYTDLTATGSFDGSIKLWKCTAEFNHMSVLFTIPQMGFVNDLKFSNDGQYLIAAVGQEHRSGRWWSVKGAKNSVVIYKLGKLTSDTV